MLQINVKPNHKKELKEFEMEEVTMGKNHLKNLSYHAGKAVYINSTGLKALLQKQTISSPKDIQTIIDALKDIDLEVHLNLVLFRKEQETISRIRETFNFLTCSTQYPIGNYMIDLYIEEYRIAVECDEYGHRDRDPEYEQQREDYIKKTLKCKFVRFNPDAPDFDIFRVISRIVQIIHQSKNE